MSAYDNDPRVKRVSAFPDAYAKWVGDAEKLAG